MGAARFGADIHTNSALRLAIYKARDNSMPKESIERAIKKGSGELKATEYESLLYEGYGAGGAAILVEALTDNKNRTYPEVRKIFQKYHGTMAEMGAVGWMFQKKGVFVIQNPEVEKDKLLEIALESGVEDVEEQDENTLLLLCEPTQFAQVRDGLVQHSLSLQSSGLEYLAEQKNTLTEEHLLQVKTLIEKLEEQDDVQNVFHNVENLFF
jgi:YebC/PmpR family DNA-binding regulatory protein